MISSEKQIPKLSKKKQEICSENTELEPSKKLEQILRELSYRKYQNPIEFFEDLPQQLLFENDLAKVKGLLGGNRSGKTEKGAHYVIKKCLAKKNQRWWIVAENFKDSVNVQQRKIWNLLPKCKVRYGEYSEVGGFTNEKLIFKNGSIMMFKTYAQGREAFQSDDIDGIWNDEEPPYAIYREERMRLIDRDGEMIFTMTALRGITQLLEEIFDGYEAINTKYAPLIKEHIPTIIAKDGMKFYMLWTTDNPYVNNQRTINEAKLMNREEIKARIYGLPVNLKGRVYPRFSKDIHVIKMGDVPFSDCSFLNVVDPHDRKPYAIIWAAVNSLNNLYIFHELPFGVDFNDIAYGNKTYDEYASEIKEIEMQIRKFGGVNFFDRIIDPNYGNSTIKLAQRQGGQSSTTVKKEFAKRGLKFRDGIDMREEGHLKVREYLHYEEKYNDAGDKEIVVHPKLFVVENCINTISHLGKYSHKDPETPGGDIRDRVGLIEKYKDFADCFDVETEILTENGWVRFKNLQKNIKVATVNMNNNKLEFQKPTEYFEYDYTGEMIKIKSRAIDLLVTPNHRMLIGNQHGGKRSKDNRKISFKLAKDLRPQQTIPMACGGIFNKGKKIKIGKYEIDEKDWAGFLGIYLSEGCSCGVMGGKIQMPGRGYEVVISQSKNSKDLEEINKLLKRLPFNFRYHQNGFHASSKILWEKLRPLGNKYQKYFPKEVWGFSREAMKELWRFLIIGDGWNRKGTNINTYATTSIKLANDIQRLLVLMGMGTAFLTRKGLAKEKFDLVKNNVVKKFPKNGFKDQYWIANKLNVFGSLCRSGQEKQKRLAEKTFYNGMVYCVSVPNQTLVVRRNNKVAITGNCVRYLCMSNPRKKQHRKFEVTDGRAY